MKEREFPQEMVEQRAQELASALYSTSGTEWRWDCSSYTVREWWFNAARLSLRREVEACEPLVEALERIGHESPHNFGEGPCACCVAADALRVHRARYAPAPAPEALADVAREAAEALRGNAALSARLLAAVGREKGGA